MADKHTLSRVLKYVKNYAVLITLSLLLAAVTVALTLYIPVLAGRAIDCIVGKDAVNFSLVREILTETVVIAVVTALLQWIMNNINNYVTYNVVRDVRNDAFRKVQNLPLSFIDTHRAGEIVSRIIADAEQFSDGLLMGFTQLFTGAVAIFGTLFFMFRLNVGITFAVIVLTPMSLFAAKFIAGKTYSMFRKQSEVRGEQTALIDEMIGNQKVVKAFAYEKRAQAKFNAVNDELEKYSLRAIFFSSLTNPVTRFVNAIVYACVALFGAFSVIGGGITIGGLSCFLSYANQYTKPFNEISGVITELQNALACAARLFELIDEPEQTKDAEKSLGIATGRVDMDNVSFSYTSERKLIENLNLHVRPGQKIAVVGPTGCGKTTLINLLMRFYDVKNGAVYVDGEDIREVTRRSLRKNYGMVLQDTWLKNATVRENITFGKPNATDDEVVAAAKAAHSHGFIKRLPNGYDTVISDDGQLSQGEKQLLCITRVMLCLPPMLILDEATSSIDTRTEIKIQDAFKRLMKGRTSFIVAHRLSTIMDADVILVMKDGNIIEQGTHDELMQNNGFYTELYNSQFK